MVVLLCGGSGGRGSGRGSSGSGPWGSASVRPRATSIWRRSRAANSGRGATGTSDRRRASSGSGVILTPLSWVSVSIGTAERDPGPDQQGLGRVDRAIELIGDLRYRQAVE